MNAANVEYKSTAFESHDKEAFLRHKQRMEDIGRRQLKRLREFEDRLKSMQEKSSEISTIFQRLESGDREIIDELLANGPKQKV